MAELPGSFQHHIEIRIGGSPVEHLTDATGLSGRRIKQAMQKGAVWLTREGRTTRLRRAGKSLQSDDVLHIYYSERVLAEVPPRPRLIADEGAYSVWHKPYGLRSQGSRWGDHCTIHRWAEMHLRPQRPAFVVHRLDRAATGLMLVAHRKRVATRLGELFQARAVEKRYRAVVHRVFPPTPQPVRIDTAVDGREACSHVTRLAGDPDLDRSLLEVVIETGRKHQIRIHLAGTGFPVVGDRLYGPGGDAEDLQLAASFLAFRCPVDDEEKRFQLPEALLPALNGANPDRG
jgi:tRNA pseudouridine32 synthase/23S rRNA pseudouridine746 synthase